MKKAIKAISDCIECPFTKPVDKFGLKCSLLGIMIPPASTMREPINVNCPLDDLTDEDKYFYR